MSFEPSRQNHVEPDELWLSDAAAYERSEDPIYVLENNIPIDTKYYLENQLSNPLMRIFEPILGEKASSLCKYPTNPGSMQRLWHEIWFTVAGDHTRTIQIATPTVGGLMKFAVKTTTCLGCKTPLRPSNSVKGDKSAVCNNCRPRVGELYQKQVTTTSDLQVRFSRLWTQCQRCQGSLHQVRHCYSWSTITFTRLTAPPGCALFIKRLPYFLHEEESSEGRRRR